MGGESFCWNGERLLLLIIAVIIIGLIFYIGEGVSSIFPREI